MREANSMNTYKWQGHIVYNCPDCGERVNIQNQKSHRLRDQYTVNFHKVLRARRKALQKEIQKQLDHLQTAS